MYWVFHKTELKIWAGQQFGQHILYCQISASCVLIVKSWFFIPVWYTNKITIIDFTIYTQLFLVKLKSVVDGPILHFKSVVDGPILHSKSVVDGPILHSKSVVDGSILYCKAKVCVFSVFIIVKLLIYRTEMCIKGPESWWIEKSITPQLVVNQSKINP